MNPNTIPAAVSPEELRQQIAAALEKALLHPWEHQEPEPLWDVYKPEGMALVLADAAISVLSPAIRRALQRDAAIEAAHRTGDSGEYFLTEWEVAGWVRDAAEPLMQVLKQVGVTMDADGRPYPTCEGSYQCAASTHIFGCFMSRPEAVGDTE